jgi:hypothetical protein
MGMMKFLLPAGTLGPAARDLERTSVAGGQDSMPYPTQVVLEPGQMTVVRAVDESGVLLAPWEINGSGRVMASSATLMERPHPYHLLLELARGKVNQVRAQVSDWVMGGLEMTPALAERIHQATQAFVGAIVNAPDGHSQAQVALAEGYQAAAQLVQTYMDQVYQLRHQRQARFDTVLGCRIGTTIPSERVAGPLTETLNAVSIPFPWKDIEPTEGDYHWDPSDGLVGWAQEQGLRLQGGPLVDFGGTGLPEWVLKRSNDLQSLAGTLADHIQSVVSRYRSQVRVWQVTAASNAQEVLAAGDEELLWLTRHLAEAARQVDSSLEILVGIAQPWGDYLVNQDHTHSPFLFADTLVRSGLRLAGLDLEVAMAVTPRGSYCRDLLEVSRLLDLYALLGLPLHVTLGYPSSDGPDGLADPSLSVSGGNWKGGYSPQVQADWAAAFGGLTLCKPFVRGVQWLHCHDAEPHLAPHCGLVDAKGNPKPALGRLRELRQAHLK